jgi:cytochrome c556
VLHLSQKFWLVNVGVAGLAVTSAISYAAAPITPATAADYAVNKRMVIRATAEEQAHVLTEMNDFLSALHTINTAVASKDFETVAKTASAIAKHSSSEKPAVELSFESKIPQEWKSFARPLRQGFSEVAQAARQDPTIENVMSKLAKTTQNCVACHATFKIVTP